MVFEEGAWGGIDDRTVMVRYVEYGLEECMLS